MSFTTNVGQNWAALVAVVIFLAAGLGYLRWAKSQGAISTINLLNEEINALKLQNARLDGDNRTLNGKFDEQTERVKLLTSLVQGVPAWETLKNNYATLALAIKSLDPVIAVFQRHVDEQDHMYAWLKVMRDRIDQLVEMYPGVGAQVEHLRDTKVIKDKVVNE